MHIICIICISLTYYIYKVYIYTYQIQIFAHCSSHKFTCNLSTKQSIHFGIYEICKNSVSEPTSVRAKYYVPACCLWPLQVESEYFHRYSWSIYERIHNLNTLESNRIGILWSWYSNIFECEYRMRIYDVWYVYIYVCVCLYLYMYIDLWIYGLMYV